MQISSLDFSAAFALENCYSYCVLQSSYFAPVTVSHNISKRYKSKDWLIRVPSQKPSSSRKLSMNRTDLRYTCKLQQQQQQQQFSAAVIRMMLHSTIDIDDDLLVRPCSETQPAQMQKSREHLLN
jgi:hypothetical protein